MQTVASNDSSSMILVEDVRKVYRLGQTPLDPLRVALGLRPHRAHSEHRAVDGISLDIKKGETVGILGVNGAGKSTLLQMITGTLRPTSGKVQVFGRIAALLELGAGFNPQWTGRKNAEFQCVLQGVPAVELPERIAAIEAFADIGDYFDEPTRTYSSGMYVRVAFACSVASEPDILIVDEALAVGDLKFQNKCFRRFEEMQKRGCTVLFVTHSPDLVTRFCTRGLILHLGQLLFDGPTADAVRIYMNLTTGANLQTEPAPADDVQETVAPQVADVKAMAPPGAGHPVSADWAGLPDRRAQYNPQELRSGSGGAKFTDAVLHRGDRRDLASPAKPGETLFLTARVRVFDRVAAPELGLILRSKTNQILSGASNLMVGSPLPVLEPGSALDVTWSFRAHFLSGDYFIDLGISDLSEGDRLVLDLRQSMLHFTISSPKTVFGLVEAEIDLTDFQWIDRQRPPDLERPRPQLVDQDIEGQARQ